MIGVYGQCMQFSWILRSLHYGFNIINVFLKHYSIYIYDISLIWFNEFETYLGDGGKLHGHDSWNLSPLQAKADVGSIDMQLLLALKCLNLHMGHYRQSTWLCSTLQQPFASERVASCCPTCRSRKQVVKVWKWDPMSNLFVFPTHPRWKILSFLTINHYIIFDIYIYIHMKLAPYDIYIYCIV